MNDKQRASLFVFGQFALLVLLLVWPSDQSGWGLLDFLFEFIGVLFVFGGTVLVFLALRLLFKHSIPELKGPLKDRNLKALRVIWPEPSNEAKLVTSGLFKTLRHPIYSGLLLIGYGIGIGSGPVPHLFFAIALHVVLSKKALLEEKFLSEKFPEYSVYLTKTGRFFPKVED